MKGEISKGRQIEREKTEKKPKRKRERSKPAMVRWKRARAQRGGPRPSTTESCKKCGQKKTKKSDTKKIALVRGKELPAGLTAQPVARQPQHLQQIQDLVWVVWFVWVFFLVYSFRFSGLLFKGKKRLC